MLTCCQLYCTCRDRVGSVPLRVILPKYQHFQPFWVFIFAGNLWNISRMRSSAVNPDRLEFKKFREFLWNTRSHPTFALTWLMISVFHIFYKNPLSTFKNLFRSFFSAWKKTKLFCKWSSFFISYLWAIFFSNIWISQILWSVKSSFFSGYFTFKLL